MKLHHALTEWDRTAAELLLAMPAIHVDETSLRFDPKNHWIQVNAAGGINPFAAVQIPLAGDAADLIDVKQQPNGQIANTIESRRVVT